MTAPRNPTCVRRSSGLNVRFHVEAVLPETRSVLATILSVPSGMTQAQMPGQKLNEFGQNVIEICDPLGCYFNEPGGELLAREGWAAYTQPLPGQAEPCQPAGYPADPQWEVFALCCPLPTCDEL